MKKKHKDTDIFSDAPPKKEKLWRRGFFVPLLGWFPRMPREKSVYGILLAAAAADGNMHRLELAEIHVLAERIRSLRNVPRAKLNKMQEQIRPHLETKKHAAFTDLATRSLRTAKKDQRASVFMHALDILFADRMLTDSEKSFIRQLGHQLYLSDEDVGAYADVMATKNLH
ncbi:MAG: TerB family tellurite resistance protein [Hyphomonadaceae bacterium]